MDNMGAGGGSSEKGPVFGSHEVAAPMGEVSDFQEFVNRREDLKPKMELPPELAENAEAAGGEKVAEQQMQAMPVATPATAKSADEQAVEAAQAELGAIEIRRDAENLPKAYMRAVAKIIERDRKDPHRLVAELDVARWDMMSKAFNRKKGDGLSGRM